MKWDTKRNWAKIGGFDDLYALKRKIVIITGFPSGDVRRGKNVGIIKMITSYGSYQANNYLTMNICTNFTLKSRLKVILLPFSDIASLKSIKAHVFYYYLQSKRMQSIYGILFSLLHTP